MDKAMTIDFLFEKGIIPWGTIWVKDEKKVKKMILKETSPQTRRVQLTDIGQCVSLVKRNIWFDGIEGITEIFLSIDGNFCSVLDGDRLPYSLEIPIAVDDQNKIIRIPSDVALVTDAKSQNRWKVATIVQIISTNLLVALAAIIIALALKKLWIVIMASGIGISMCLLCCIGVIKRAKRILAAINDNSGC